MTPAPDRPCGAVYFMIMKFRCTSTEGHRHNPGVTR